MANWRCLSMLKNTFIPTSYHPKLPSTNSHLASFHSTPVWLEKWKSKWNPFEDIERSQQPSKTHTKYTTRLKRANTKRALKDLLLQSGSSKASILDEDHPWPCDAEPSVGSSKNKRKKSSAQRSKISRERTKRKSRKQSFSEEFADPETTFRARFGNKWYAWSFNKSSQSSSAQSDWNEDRNWRRQRYKAWDCASENDTEDSYPIGSSSDRRLLGLPISGPLKVEDVKNAFRLSALKWHPDKHQGPLQATAEEKFKLCVNAYKSLCEALS